MTAQEKAIELVDWFQEEGLNSSGRYQSTDREDFEGARVCSLKLVEEMIDFISEDPYYKDYTWWNEVKEEIVKLTFKEN